MSKVGGSFGLFEPKREPPGSKRVVNCASKLISSKQASKQLLTSRYPMVGGYL